MGLAGKSILVHDSEFFLYYIGLILQICNVLQYSIAPFSSICYIHKDL